MAEETEGRWIVITTFPSGDTAYYGENSQRAVGRTPYRGNAYRFWTQNEALGAGYHAKESGLIADFTVFEIVPPRFKNPDTPEP